MLNKLESVSSEFGPSVEDHSEGRRHRFHYYHKLLALKIRVLGSPYFRWSACILALGHSTASYPPWPPCLV